MPPARLARAADVAVEELDGRLLLLRDGALAALVLDEVATRVWQRLSEPATAEEVAHWAAQTYTLSVEQAAADLRPALALLLKHGALVELP